jgi:glycosyltransferase involved in cell wall biosynthesis
MTVMEGEATSTMRVWIVNQYAQPPSRPGGTRHHMLAKALVKRGHSLTIIASSQNYLTRAELSSGRVESIEGVRYVWLSAGGYSGPAGRLMSMTGFAARVLDRASLCGLERPHVVVGSSPHPFAAAAARHLAHRYGVPFVLEVRDLWPDTLVDVGQISRRHPLIVALSRLERSLYRSADHVITLLPGAAEVIERRGGRRGAVTWLPNGADLSEIPHPRAREPGSVFTLTYAGAHGPANALDLLVETARLLQQDGDGWLIRLIGDGPEKLRLQNRAWGLKLDTIRFEPPLPKERIHASLAESDAFILPLKRGPVFQHGVSPNKLFDYFAVGRPVIFAVDTSIDPVREADAGLSIPAEDPPALVDALRRLRGMSSTERAEMGLRGRRHVEASHDIRRLGGQFESVLRAAIGQPLRPSPAKRAIDIVGAAAALAAAAVSLGVIAWSVRRTMGSPVLFRQSRPGLGNRSFRIMKFRSMRDALGIDGRALPDNMLPTVPPRAPTIRVDVSQSREAVSTGRGVP